MLLKLRHFFWICSGADRSLLEKCSTEANKYAGLGATIFFTGLFAFLSASYAVYTVFDSVAIAVLIGLAWGLMIFNLDRYIVSGMRKVQKRSQEWLMAAPRIALAIIIAVVIATPLELRIFEKELAPELEIMAQEKYSEQENKIRSRFQPLHDSLANSVRSLKTELQEKALWRDALVRAAQEEADGTGGSKRRNLGPIFKLKKADADKAETEYQEMATAYGQRIRLLEQMIDTSEVKLQSEINALSKAKPDGLAGRLEALNRITGKHPAILRAHWFILLLFIAIEIAPVLVKLITVKGPYDNLLNIEEDRFMVQEAQEIALTHAAAKEKTAGVPNVEQSFVQQQLDTPLKT